MVEVSYGAGVTYIILDFECFGCHLHEMAPTVFTAKEGRDPSLDCFENINRFEIGIRNDTIKIEYNKPYRCSYFGKI